MLMNSMNDKTLSTSISVLSGDNTLAAMNARDDNETKSVTAREDLVSRNEM